MHKSHYGTYGAAYGRPRKIPVPVKKYYQSNVDDTLVMSVPKTSSHAKPIRINPKSGPSQKPTRVTEPVEVAVVQVQTRPLGVDSRVIMTNKACDTTPSIKKDAQQIGSTTMPEQYNNLLLEQYGFNPSMHAAASFDRLKPIEKVLMDPVPVRVDYSSQCVNATTDTGTNGTAIDMAYNFSTAESTGNGRFAISPKDIEISNAPRLKVIAEKFTRFKKDHIELRRLDERIICVEYDVFCKQDMIKQPVQVMRAYFCVKTNCNGCQNSGGIFRTVPSSIKNSPLADDEYTTELEKEVEMIEENLPENKCYLRDLRVVLKKRQAINAKKKKSSLDLMSMYTMAKNEMPPRDHDWSNTNLLSKAELLEVKDLIMKRCESRMYNVSRKRMKHNSNPGAMGKSDSFYSELFRDFDSNPK